MKQSAIVIGAGIVGLAMARALAIKGYEVSVFERNHRAVGASVRNFGMVWPIGQPSGKLYARAMRSRTIWKELCAQTGIWFEEAGSLHLCYHPDELQVIKELAEIFGSERGYTFLDARETQLKAPNVNPLGLLGALWSPQELIVEAREAIPALALALQEKYSVKIYWNTAISSITGNTIHAGNMSWSANHIYLCSGADFETLYPEVYKTADITKCKLQMMRTVPQPMNHRIGPALCGGLSLIHYKCFESAPSLSSLKQRYEADYKEYLKWGIHVMTSQNQEGCLTIGDSHEYAPTHDPFNREDINRMILQYFETFANVPTIELSQKWAGIYPKMLNEQTEFVVSPEKDVTIINGLGGAGMTLSFGLAEEIVNDTYQL